MSARPVARPESLVATCDQWVRATHTGTAVEGTRGELLLSWTEPEDAEPPTGSACPARGLATDRLCRIYRLRETSVERLVVGPTARGLDYAALPPPVLVLGGTRPTPEPAGPDFERPPREDLLDGSGIAVAEDDHLVVADAARAAVHVLDLWDRRLLRTVLVASPDHPGRRPAGIAAHGDVVHVVVQEPPGLLRIGAGREPREVPLPDGFADLPDDAVPVRVCVLPDGTPVLLAHAPDGSSWLLAGRRAAYDVGPASDVAVDRDGAVVVAPCPRPDGRATLRRVVPTGDGWTPAHPLDAGGYDGGGIVATRDGRIGYTVSSGSGFRLAVAGRVDYATDGSCLTYRLDSGQPRNVWGRVLLEACVPDGTACLVGTITSDDEHPTAIAHHAALPAACEPATPAATPDLPPERLAAAAGPAAGGLHRRPDAVTAWWLPDHGLDTFEAPVTAGPGRFLWVVLRLTGNGRRSPRVRELRVEHRAHTLLRRLPALFAAEEEQADFLQRYLAGFDGVLHDLDLRAQCRDLLVDPESTPVEALDWLASFVGLLLDDRWAEAARRRLVREIVPLFRRRGTLGALRTYLAIFLAGEHALDDDRPRVEPVILEHFRLRGLGGPLLGEGPARSTRSVVGSGFRVGGEVGDAEVSAFDLGLGDGTSFDTHAHRFTVLVPQPLDADQEAALRHVLDTERPAHTGYRMCTVSAGMRLGRGLHVGISSMVGPTGGFAAPVLDRSVLGRGDVLGGARRGAAVEAARVGEARVG